MLDEPQRLPRDKRPSMRQAAGPLADTEHLHRASFYAARPGGWRDWWTLLHPPYTAWHLAYVVFGACLVAHVSVSRLLATLLAFFLAVGIGAHALDELNGRPLGTRISAPVLVTLSVLSVAGAITLGVAGVLQVGLALVPFMVVGPILVVAYNLELFGGLMHTDAVFAFAWGSFPVLVAYVAQTGDVAPAPLIAAAAAFFVSAAQRHLSTPARLIRRRSAAVEGSITLTDGRTLSVDKQSLLLPLERALQALSWAMVLLAASWAVARLT